MRLRKFHIFIVYLNFQKVNVILTFLYVYCNIFAGDEMKYFIEKSALPSARAKEIIKDQLGVDVLYYENGKPYTKVSPISISHSGDFVLVGVSDSEIGVDMELIKPYNKRLITRFFSKDEQEFIKSDTDFFLIWTVKEAFLKLTGEGLKGMTKLNVVKDNALHIEGYSIINQINDNYIFSIVTKGDPNEIRNS